MSSVNDYYLVKKVRMRFAEATERVTEDLKKEGFGIITFIDLKETFKKRIGKDFRNYVVLGACNPKYAYEVLLANDKVGVFLPCSIVVQEYTKDEIEISIANPEKLMRGVDDPSVRKFASQIKDTMQNVLDGLSRSDKNGRRTNVEILM